MRVLQWIFPMVSSYGGRENFVTNLARDLEQVGDEVAVLAIDPELDQPRFVERQIGGLDVRHIGVAGLLAKRPGIFQTLYTAFEAEITNFKPDVIHAHNPEGPDLILLRALSRKFDVPMVLTIHGPMISSTEAARVAMRLVDGMAQLVVAISNFAFSETLKAHPGLESKLRLVVNGVPAGASPAVASPAVALQNRFGVTPTIFASGRFAAEKGFAQLLAAFALARQVQPQARLVLAGRGPDEALLKKYAENLGLAEYVDFPGWLTHEQVAAQLSSARMVVVPSVWSEPFGLVAVEAMQAGVPVVASNRGALPEIVRHGETGLIFESGDIFQLASSIRFLLEEPDTASEMGEKGRVLASQEFSQRRCTLQYRRIYFEALGRALNFANDELGQLAAQGGYSFYPSDLGIELQHADNLPRIVAELSGGQATTICKLTHDDPTPLPPKLTEVATIFRTSMLAGNEYRNEYPLPVLISGHEYTEWLPVEKTPKPQVGFVGWAQADLFRTAMANKANQALEQVGLKEINQAQADNALLRQPINIGIIMRKQAIATIQQNDSLESEFVLRDAYHFNANPQEVLDQRRAEYLANLHRNPYSLCIRGAGNFSIRLYETLAAGRIPVIVNSSMVLPLEGLVPWRELGVWVELTELGQIDRKILEFHEQLSEVEFMDRQRENRSTWEQYLSRQTFWNHALTQINGGEAA